MKSKQQKERERQLKILKRVAIGAIAGGLLVVGIIVFAALHRENSGEVDNSYAEWALEDSSKFVGAEVHGGNVNQLNALYTVVRDYFDTLEGGNYSYLYERFWDSDVLNTYGYTMSASDFSAEKEKIASMYHTSKHDQKHVQIIYSAVTYQDCKDFYLYTFNLQYTYYDDNGNLKSTPMVQQTYSLFPYTANDVTTYKLLDFDIMEIGNNVSRFTEIGESTGAVTQPTTSNSQQQTQSGTKEQETTAAPTKEELGSGGIYIP